MPSQSTPATVVIFGASGDLTQRKLLPALHTLDCLGYLPEATQVVGMARSPLSQDEFRDRLLEGVRDYSRSDPAVCGRWSVFKHRVSYLAGSYDDPETYRRLAARLSEIDRTAPTQGNRLYYLATPPALASTIIEQLGRAGLNESPGGWVRLVAEKPFGSDVETAHRLNQQLHRVFDERQIYRMDHYLGKETVQNILAVRFANYMFEPLWHREHIDHVQLTVAEQDGIGRRGSYYDHAGVLRDVFQNHLLQLVALAAMEPPQGPDAGSLREQKAQVLRAVQPGSRCVRGQYAGYRQERGVASDSHTATYAALELHIDNERWRGVPFYLRSGKKLAAKTSELSVQFGDSRQQRARGPSSDGPTPNVLSLCLQPDEGIHLRFQAKEPGAGMKTRPVDMGFHYRDHFGGGALPDAYERLLLDVLQGDPSLFPCAEEIELAWAVIDQVLDRWESPTASAPIVYDPGSWGPREADVMLEEDDRRWHSACVHHERAT